MRPKCPERITVRAREVNGYCERVWESAPESSRGVWDAFVEFAQDCVPVAHNPSFDRAFVTLAAAECGVVDLQMDHHWIGTETLAWHLYLAGDIEEMSLRVICDHFDIPREAEPHKAIEGAKVCKKIYCALLGERLAGLASKKKL